MSKEPTPISKPSTDSDVEFMDRQTLKAEIRKLREAIRSVVTQRCDNVCWRDAYTDLAKLVGIDYCPELIDDPEKMLANCCQFIHSLRTGGPYIPIYHERRAESSGHSH